MLASVGRKHTPPVMYFVLYLVMLVVIPLALTRLAFVPLALLAMISVHHGTHEAVHGTLFPSRHRSKLGNMIFGAIGFANFGHNFIYLRWSHMGHHRYGRLLPEMTLDEGIARNGVGGLIWYYSGLFGASCIYHEVTGYIYPLLGTKYHILDRRFSPNYYWNRSYAANQAFILVYTGALLYIGGWHFVLCRVLFTLYWGAFQNTAHYGLEVATDASARLASRTYRVAKWYEFLIFRSGTYHLEHHMFPAVPGPCLSASDVQQAMCANLGFVPPARHGLIGYWVDCVSQFRGPRAEHLEPLPWKPPGLLVAKQ